MSNKIGFLGVTMCLALIAALVTWWAGMSMVEGVAMYLGAIMFLALILRWA